MLFFLWVEELWMFFFFFQAEDGIRDLYVTGVQTCALPILHLAGRYAYAGRDWVCDRVVKILGARNPDEVHNHHNFAWKEQHGGQDVWVVRKGATPAFPGQRGFVGGSMGDDAVILEGVDPTGNPMAAAVNQEAALFSTVHGAGRVMSRNAARGRRKKVDGRWMDDPRHPGLISRDDMQRWIAK